MSQSGVLDVINSNPSIPTTFIADVGSAIPIANILEILGGTNVTTSASGNTIIIDVSGSFAETITGNDLVALSPVAGNWNIVGSGNIATSGSGNTLTATLTGLTPRAVQLGATATTLAQSNLGLNGQLLIGATGANPAFASLTSFGGTVTFTPGVNSLNLEAGGAVAIQFTTDSGIAVPVAGNINDLGSGSITTTGAGSTVTTALTGLTNHNVLIGAGTATITKVAPSATVGIALISNGAAADPSFSGPVVVAGGGTGFTSTTAYAVICGGITSTDPLQPVASVGTLGQLLTSNGPGTLPTFQTAAAPASAVRVFAYRNANVLNVTGDGTQYSVPFNATTVNTGAALNTANGRFTVPATGDYMMSGAAQVFGLLSSHNYCLIYIYNVTDSAYIFLGGEKHAYNNADVNGATQIQFSGLASLTAGKVIDVRVNVQGGTKVVDLQGGTPPGTYWSIVQIL